MPWGLPYTERNKELHVPDQTITCRDCGTNFIFSDSEQQFFAEKGFTNAPSRCPDCRRANRAGGGSSRGGGASRDRVMTDVTCSSCGKLTQVPFVPRGDRPVYCSDCFATQRGGSSYGGGRRY
ncbi:MAG TPA: zinc-ribbon domain containing protein [Chloroflexota bacterium]|nr:zinc-ribbon domain containing protein [Chloroflexota bacterium]